MADGGAKNMTVIIIFIFQNDDEPYLMTLLMYQQFNIPLTVGR
jgi:hypothetical protein